MCIIILNINGLKLKEIDIRPESFRFKNIIGWSKRIEEVYHANSNHNSTGMAILLSDRYFRSRNIAREKDIS